MVEFELDVANKQLPVLRNQDQPGRPVFKRASANICPPPGYAKLKTIQDGPDPSVPPKFVARQEAIADMAAGG